MEPHISYTVRIYGDGVGKIFCHSLGYGVIGIYWVRNEFYIITETCIIETWTDKRILTFQIQMFKFPIASLKIANILWF